eukprot:3931677-Rhodomonas_salina.1
MCSNSRVVQERESNSPHTVPICYPSSYAPPPYPPITIREILCSPSLISAAQATQMAQYASSPGASSVYYQDHDHDAVPVQGQHGVGIIFEHTDPKDGGEILVVVKQIVSYGSADRTKMLKVIRSPRVRYAQSGAERQWTGSMCF